MPPLILTVMLPNFHLNNVVVQNGKLYVGAQFGYMVINLATGEKQYVEELTLSKGRKLRTDVNTIAFDRQGGMWMGTEMRGILYAPPQNTPFRTMTWDNPLALKYSSMMEDLTSNIREFNGRKASVMYIDSRNWTWVGCATGLYLYKTPHDKPIIYSKDCGLLNNVIHAIIEDDAHNIWASTSYGISCLQVNKNYVSRVFSFNELDNVPNETFINGKAMKLDDGTIVMQALDHIVTFQPTEFDSLLMQTANIMYPKLTQMLINGINVQVGTTINGTVILDRAISRTKEINLNYDLNTVTREQLLTIPEMTEAN